MAIQKVVLCCILVGAHAATLQASVSVNPIRRVVTMMQNMQKKIAAEGERDADLHEKFMCYCKSGSSTLDASISAAETKIPQVDSSLEEAIATKKQLQADLTAHRQDRAESQEAIAEAKSIRSKEAASFANLDADHNANIAAVGKAIAALSAGVAGFLQTATASVIRGLAMNMELNGVDRDMLSAFLSANHEDTYAPQSGQIIGILKQMKDTMESDLDDATKAENAAIAGFNSLVAAREKEIEANSKSIEAKTKRDGEVGIEIVNLKEDLDDTQVSLAEDKQFLADLSKNCATAEADYAVVKKTRAEEQLALADTIKLLNSDDALELFKKTLPTPSFLQTKVAAREMTRKALLVLNGRKDVRVDLISMALRGQKVNFGKVVSMIDEMVAQLAKEQVADDEKKAFCEAEIEKDEDELKRLNQDISDLGKAIEEGNGNLQALNAEIAALAQGIKDLDKSVVDATANRKAEHAEFQDTMTSDNAAKELMGIAKNRLNKFYNPKLYVAPPKRELSAEERIVVNNGGTLAPTSPPGGISGTGITAFVQMISVDGVAPPPAPDAVGAYQQKGEESTGVIAMIDLLIADLDKEIQEMTVEENDSQAEYEQFVKDSTAKRADDSKSFADKEDAKANLEVALDQQQTQKKATVREAMARDKSLSNLHADCDWLASNFEMRKEARAGEVESLKNAKAVLSGADYSM